ncbi:ribosome maturation factor RimM [Roseivivax sp. THAF30]|uniref:ribosome maturation factor RimM n=1 Tax=Roseivivax sp. THAF30 TaxID=2587852 RepID=UPI00126918A6|nr:ribosome maturation factor RimM [Roseivivax sp. THAF30]QFT61518.1 Ribosome maturation factor RimM [Roseivivax sp. THAF30]
MSDRICVGMIGGAFGVHGEVRLKSFTADPEAIADYGPLESEDGSQSFDVQLTRPVKQGFAARLSGVRSKEDADALKSVRLYAPRERLPQLPDDEFYHADLIGLEVMDTGGVSLGHVKAVLNHGATDLLEIAPPGSSQTALLPFTREAVPTVDLAAGRLIADPPAGIFD